MEGVSPNSSVTMGKQVLLQPPSQMLLLEAACSVCLLSIFYPPCMTCGSTKTHRPADDDNAPKPATHNLDPGAGMWECCSLQLLCEMFFTRMVAEDFLEFSLLIKPSIWTCQPYLNIQNLARAEQQAPCQKAMERANTFSEVGCGTDSQLLSNVCWIHFGFRLQPAE